MMTVIEFFLLALVSIVFVLMAITPMIAEGRRSATVKRAEIVPMSPPMRGRSDLDRADAA
ncbi:MAG: hypothetical protein H0W23_00560 [Chloroflexia bacterium]|nr:hypothetical protein [Chloroflexia bacterium]